MLIDWKMAEESAKSLLWQEELTLSQVQNIIFVISSQFSLSANTANYEILLKSPMWFPKFQPAD